MTKTLGEVFRDLSYGHLANLKVGGEGMGNIPDTHQERILALVNSGVKKLASRFVVREESLVLRGTKGKLDYSLVPERADNNAELGEKYITDTAEAPFTDRIQSVLIILDENDEELILNNREIQGSVMIKGKTELRFSEMDKDQTFEVIYQPHSEPLETVDPDQEIILPEVLYEALEAYVGQRVLGSMNGEEHSAKASELLMTYELICKEALDRGLVQLSVVGGNSKLDNRGFI